jgi:RimJ/RimL family protein N-acetyltransferase
MISLRSITENDCDFILRHWAGHSVVFKDGLTGDELLSMIHVWDSKLYDGNYYQMFGITNDGVLVGTLSLYQKDANVNSVYLGFEIDGENRRKGFATAAIRLSFAIAKEKGYERVESQARITNIASVKLHLKCGFEITEQTLSKRGHEVYNFSRKL